MAENKGGGWFDRFKSKTPDRPLTLEEQLKAAGKPTAGSRQPAGQSLLEKWGLVKPRDDRPPLEEQLKALGKQTADERPSSEQSAQTARGDEAGTTVAGRQLQQVESFGKPDFPGASELLDQYKAAFGNGDIKGANQLAKIAAAERSKLQDRFKK